jgi:hypothetical protein
VGLMDGLLGYLAEERAPTSVRLKPGEGVDLS